MTDTKRDTAEGLQQSVKQFPIVAIGASAGGLEPFEQFFDNTKDHTGIAFVIIQHLSPNFHSMMDELLARHSNMKIERVVDGMVVEPNTIYLNPPRTEMSIKSGVFKLASYADDRTLNLPIDTFFVSLAEEVGEKAIAIVLSGTGSDGTQGSKAIKAVGGTVFVQDVSSAKFDGMPSSVINLGYADVVGHPAMLAENINRLVNGQPMISEEDEEKALTPSQRVLKHLRERFGTEFSYYKSATINRRLERRATLKSMSFPDYAEMLMEDRDEAAAMYADLLIEVTAFFRDAEAFEELRVKVLPDLAKRMSKARPIRIWVPGCASGEEAYSMAIMFADYALEHGLDLNLKIIATDIHHRSLDAASAGIYQKSNLNGLSQEQIERYFEAEGDYYQIKQNLRRIVVFSPHNILKDPPFTRMDLISCRNVLIYFKEIAQQKTVALFHFALVKSGYLFLGPSETTGKLEHEFEAIGNRWRLFRKRRDVRLLEATSMLPPDGKVKTMFDPVTGRSVPREFRPAEPTLKHAHDETLKEMLRLYAPPGFLLNRDGEIQHVFGDSGSFLNVESGVFSNKITDLVDNDLKLIVATGLERAKSAGKLPFERRVATSNSDLGEHSVVISLRAIANEDATQGFLLLTMERIKRDKSEIIPLDVAPMQPDEASRVMQSRITDLERDLLSTEESLQSTIEELETSNEELQATNEELMASNEELQSTNEELHSVNEELYTVSTEHQRKVEELMESTDDMDHLLKATDIGIIFLDDNSKIRRFTPTAKKTFNLIAEDLGRPIDHVTYRFESLPLVEEIKTVRKTGVPFEKEVSVEDQTYMLRILPYRASLQEIAGAVITSIDITDLKKAESRRIETKNQYESIVSDLTDIVIRWDASTHEVTYCNKQLADRFGTTVDQINGSNIAFLGALDKEQSIFARLAQDEADTDFRNEILCYDAAGRQVFVSGTIRAIRGKDQKIFAYQATARDVTAPFRYRSALEALVKLNEGAASPDESSLLQNALEIACEYLDISCCVLTKYIKKDCQILATAGERKLDLTPGEIYSRRKTLGAAFKPSDGVYAFEDIADSPIDPNNLHKQVHDMRSFIGIQIKTANNVVLSLNFMSQVERNKPFAHEEKMFLQLLSRAVAYLIERKEFIKNLENRRAHFVSIYDRSPIMKCTLGADGTISEMNDAFNQTLGYPLSEIIGKRFTKFVTKSSQDNLWKGFPKSAGGDSGQKTLEIELKCKSGATVITELSSNPFLTPESTDELYLIAMIDVTERNHAFKEVAYQKEALERANEGLSTFAYVASHDLQEPLRKIQQYVEMFEADHADKIDKNGKYFLDVISGSAARIRSLVTDILSYTTATNAKVDIAELDLSSLLKDVIENVSNEAGGSKAAITLGKLPVVSGDRSAVEIIFQNLISNSLKYQPKDAKPVISIKHRKLKSGTFIEVSDNGIGIEEPNGKSIFEPFVRLHNKHDFSGSGIGLAICKNFCERMGWEIAYRPNPTGGTIFSIKTS